MLLSSPMTYVPPLQYAKPVTSLPGPVTSYVQQPATSYVYQQIQQLPRQQIVPTVQIPIQTATLVRICRIVIIFNLNLFGLTLDISLFQQYETREVKEQRPKVTYETQVVQVPKTIEVPQTVKDTRIVTVDKEVYETKWIPVQVL